MSLFNYHLTLSEPSKFSYRMSFIYRGHDKDFSDIFTTADYLGLYS